MIVDFQIEFLVAKMDQNMFKGNDFPNNMHKALERRC